MLADKRSNLVRGIAEGLEAEFKDLDSATAEMEALDLGDITDFDSLVSSIRSAAANADEATAKRLNDYADALEGAKSAAETDFAEAYKQAQDRLKENTYEYKGSTFLQAAAANYSPETNGDFWEYIKSYVSPNGETWNNDWNTAVTGNNGIVAAMSLLSSGGLTNGQFSQFVADQMNGAGKNHDYYDLLAQAALGSNYRNGEFVGEGLSEALESMKGNENLAGFYDELISKFPELEDAAKKGGVALKRLNENWKSDKVADVSKYAKGVNGLSDIMNDLAQGGNKARKAEMQLNAEMVNLQDQQTAVNKARGKSGKELQKAKKKGDQTLDMLASLVPYDADQLANMTADELAKVVDEAEPMIADNFADTIESLFAMLPETDVPINLSDIVKVHADGSIELNDVANVLTDAEENILQMILSLVGKYADIDVGAILKGDTVTVESFVSALRKAGVKGGSGYSRKSSGGGGGKSAAQAAIDAAKHYAAEAQHMTKMAEADLYHPDKMNDFAGYAGAVQANVFTLQQEGQVWRDQIAYLEEQRSKVKEGTDDWWSLTEAINGYTESLAGLEEQIDNINAKLLEEAKEEFGYKITAAQHRLTMGTTDRTFYQRTNDYDKELESIDSLNVEYGALEETYREAIAMYKALQGNVEEGTDQWWTYQQEIYSTIESLAELKNTVAQLNAEKLGIYIEKQENEDKPENNAYALMDLYKTRYLNNEDYTAYETLMEERKTLLEQSINSNATQVRELEILLSEFEEGSDEWISTRDQIWAIKLDTATKENEYIELEKELAEQRLAQISQSYERETAYENHAVTMYDTYGNMYKSVSNYAGYQSTLRQQVSMFEDIKSAAETARDAALEEMASLEKGTPEWYNARDAVYKYEEAIATTYASIMEKKFAIEESLANALIESYTDDMSLFDQQAKLLENQRKKYDNHNDYGGYITTLREENKVLQEQTDSRREYLAQLQERLANTTIGTDAWKNLRKEILSVEQAISSAEVTLDNFEQELEKSKIDYYLEKMDRAQSNRTHALTMIQYEETKYQNAGELSNYGIMLEKENEQRQKNIKALERDIELLNEELDQVEEGSKQYQRLIDAIKKKEEAIAADSNAIEKNNKLLEENQNKIKQTRKTLEDQVDAEIKKRKEQAKTELNATVTLQNQILNVVKQRYRDEWDLQKQDMQKKKDALSEEKQLINERLEARKSAMDAEDKYEELRDLQQQLALLSNDPTRTKEAKELSKKIADIRKDISWDRAAEEAETATERIDDEIRAMDEWIQVNEENLTSMLEDAHNFSEEINDVLAGSYEDIISWMMENNTEFKNSLDEAQQQMIEGWETTWKTMHGIVDTYWDQINDILSSKDNFIKFMQESVDYITASEAGKATMLYAWSKGYDTMFGAESVDESLYDYEAHDHEEDEVGKAADEIAAAMEEALKWTYNADWWENGLKPAEDLLVSVVDTVASHNELGLPETGSDIVPSLEDFMDKYSGVGVKKDDTPPSSYAQVNTATLNAKTETTRTTTSTKKTTTSKSTTSTSSGDSDKYYDVYDEHGIKTNWQIKAGSADEAKEKLKNDSTLSTYYSTGGTGKDKKDSTTTKVFATGGLVDYTGPAWVDGTPTKPEAFLSVYDTEQIGKLAEALRYVYVSPGFAPSEKYFGNSTTVGDIVININQAELKDDADYEEVARRVGAAFTKQLSKEGLTLTGYSF